MATTWKSLQLPKLPASVQTAVTQLGTVSQSLISVLRIVKTSIETLSSLNVLGLDATQTAVQAALSAIEDAVKSLTEDTGLYVLYVPVQRKIVISPIVKDALASTGTSLTTNDVASTLLTNVTVAATDKYDAKLATFYSSLANASGGNAGFVRAVAESLEDIGDSNRPQLSVNSYVTGMYLLAGGADFLSVLNFITSITALIAPRQPATALDVPGEPVAKGLRARTAAGDVLLAWDFQEPLVEIPTLNLTALVTQVAIIRSTSPDLLTKTTVQEVFGTGTLTEGMAAGSAVVLSMQSYTGFDLTNSYRDTSVERGTTYYYAVAYDYKGGSSADIVAGAGTSVGFRALSNVVKTTVTTSTPTRRSTRSTPPDWVRTPSVLGLLPDVSRLVDSLLISLEQFGDFTGGYNTMLKTYVEFLDQEISSFEKLAEDALQLVSRVAALTNTSDLGGAYMASFSGQGDEQFLVQDLSAALAPSADSDRPPFDRGDEFVTGLVLLATAPSAAGLAPVSAMLELLFGTVEEEGSVVEQALSQIDVALRQAEDVVFDPSIALPPPPLPLAVGDEDDGVKDLNCPTVPAFVGTFSDDFQPKE